MKTFVVGDIHGRCAQLNSLLQMLPRDEESDLLIFLGDLVDRGPDAPGCVEYVLNMKESNPERVICLRGNHEEMGVGLTITEFLSANALSAVPIRLVWMSRAVLIMFCGR